MNDELTKRYDNIIIDSVNMFYRVCDTKNETPTILSQKAVYKNAICDFIKQVEYLKDRYLYHDGSIYLLFDNYFSRADLQSTFTYADRKNLDEAYKATRKKENKPFYQSLNFIRFYYIIGPSMYKTARIDGLEADDLVKPLIEGRCKGQSCLFVTNDLDWSRYMSKDIDWIPNFGKGPQTIEDLSLKMKFPINEVSVIVYKSLFGDSSDNIKNIVPNNEKNFENFRELLPTIHVPEQLIYIARNVEKRDVHNILKYVNENEKQYQINCQLISSIECSSEKLDEVMTIGHDDKILYKTVREALELDVSEKKYIFGKVKRPRK